MERDPVIEGKENIIHHLDCDGMYAKEFHLVAGGWVLEHAHKIDHFGFLAYGEATLNNGQLSRPIVGPAIFTIKAHVAHSIHATTALGWVCIWPNPDRDSDPEVIDAKVSAN